LIITYGELNSSKAQPPKTTASPVPEKKDIATLLGEGLAAMNSSKTAPSSGPNTPESINALYKKYFGRDATQAEVSNWSKESSTALDSFLQKEQLKYGVTPTTIPSTTNTAAEYVDSWRSKIPKSTGPELGPSIPGTVDSTSTTGDAGLTGWDALKSAVESGLSKGMGAEATVDSILNDPNTLIELRKLYPGVPDWALPTGASLAGQLDKLKDLRREEAGLESTCWQGPCRKIEPGIGAESARLRNGRSRNRTHSERSWSHRNRRPYRWRAWGCDKLP